MTTDLLTVHILGATDDPAYVFASPGRSSHGPKLAKCLFSLPVEKVGLHESAPFTQWGEGLYSRASYRGPVQRSAWA